MTTLQQRRKLDSIEIREPEGLAELVEKTFHTNKGSFGFAPTNLKVPLFVYREKITRDENGIITHGSHTERYIANDKDQGSTGYSIYREVLSLKSNSIGDAERGKILVAFCQIEFILDILVLYVEGVYEGKCTYASFYREMMAQEGDPFHTFSAKKNYLKFKKIISNETHTQLSKVQKIRNHVAHQYFLSGGVSMNMKDLAQYDSMVEALEMVFNYCWLNLLKDYNKYQVPILESVLKNTAKASNFDTHIKSVTS